MNLKSATTFTAFPHQHGPWVCKLCSTSGRSIVKAPGRLSLVMIQAPSLPAAGILTQCNLDEVSRWMTWGTTDKGATAITNLQTVLHKWT